MFTITMIIQEILKRNSTNPRNRYVIPRLIVPSLFIHLKPIMAPIDDMINENIRYPTNFKLSIRQWLVISYST